jgi:Phage tail sheath C-terminal domain
MTLVSPGVEIDIIDQSQYVPSSLSTVPYFLIATASNKPSGSGVGIAPGTLPENANNVYLITSQRDLAATYGTPLFYTTSSGTPINGYELNEYGLLAAYSSLGLSSACYVQRVDVDLSALTPTTARPKGAPNNGTYWLNTTSSVWGIFQWNQVTGSFSNVTPIQITDTNDLQPSSDVPLQSFGSIGNYAVTTTYVYNPLYYKRGGATSLQTSSSTISDLYNTWVLVGSDDWRTAFPTVYGTLYPSNLVAANTFGINGVTITVPAAPNNTVNGLQTAINSANIPGVYAANINGALNIYGTSEALNGSNNGQINITNGIGSVLATLGITAGVYSVPQYQASPSYTVPRWRTSDTTPAPSGSIWQKTNNVNLGMLLNLERYNSVLGQYVTQSCTVYTNDAQANYALDPSAGGQNIPAGSTYAQIGARDVNTSNTLILERYAVGPTVITGTVTDPGPFNIGDSFTIQASEAAQGTYSSGVATLTGSTASDFVSAISAAAVPHVVATINASGYIVITHTQGGSIDLINNVGTPVALAGFNTTIRGVRTYYVDGSATGLTLSNWVTTPTFTYTPDYYGPDQDPPNGTLWYYSADNQADIMIQNNGAWVGYKTVTNDARGDNLTLTNASGPIFSYTPPTTQNDANNSPLQYGDLWIDTSQLDNYPVLSRWSNVNGQDQWILVSNSDATTQNGILFADARWAPNGTTNPITDPYPTIVSLLTSSYLDLDAPEADLYPEGLLLFNTRRSGYNVKRFAVNYFNPVDYPDQTLPEETNTWVTQSGNAEDGAAYMGSNAQRAIIVAALKSGIDTSTQAREESRLFTLLASPQYPELIPNMIMLNNDRSNTGFIVGDTPLTLDPPSILTYAAGDDTGVSKFQIGPYSGLPGDDYVGVFYPSCTTTDTNGTVVVQPPSHMMVRTIIHNDQIAYPWFAPAGTRRGIVDNALTIGYITAETGKFNTVNVNQGMRDVLYQNEINPITFIPGIGITNFGNKTTTSNTTAMNRINVARLVAYLRAQLETIGKQYLFEPNDQITRNEISNAITSLLNGLVAKRALYDFLVICDLSNNTPSTIDNNELWVDIAIEPVKAIEFIYIPVRIMNTGAIAALSATTATA